MLCAPGKDLGGDVAGPLFRSGRERRYGPSHEGDPFPWVACPPTLICPPGSVSPPLQSGFTCETPRPSSWRTTQHRQLRAPTSLPSPPHHKCGPPRRPGDWLLMPQPPVCRTIQENCPRDGWALPVPGLLPPPQAQEAFTAPALSPQTPQYLLQAPFLGVI